MSKTKRTLNLLLLIAITALAVLVLPSCTTAEPPSGTWQVEELSPGAITSKFMVEVAGLAQATHYELSINGYIVGERVPLNEELYSAGAVFANPSVMEVRFFSGDDKGLQPLAAALCDQAGKLIFQ